jgi:uncharacterized Zn finger protein
MPRAPKPELHWWAKQWVDAMESLGPNYATRLQRARSYARNAHVWQLRVRPGVISAQVLGSYGYYTSTIKVPAIPGAVWSRALEPLAERPALLASLLADDLPTEVESILNEAGGSLFHSDPDVLTYSCSCPDWERPCKHALAVCYDFAARCDRQPALLLALAGRTVDDLMAAIRARWAAENEKAQAASAPASEHPLRAVSFYEAGAALDDFAVPLNPPQIHAALLLQLGKPPFAGPDEDPLTPLAGFYGEMTEQALRTLSRTGYVRDRQRKDDEL